jgi:hypothetical protein
MSLLNQNTLKSTMIKLEVNNIKKTNENFLKLNLNQRRNSLDSISKSTMTRTLSRPSFIQKSSEKYIFNKNNGIRCDVFGNKIIKGSKNHKVTFIDEISREKISEVFLYNIESKYSNLKNNDNCQCNACFIF